MDRERNPKIPLRHFLSFGASSNHHAVTTPNPSQWLQTRRVGPASGHSRSNRALLHGYDNIPAQCNLPEPPANYDQAGRFYASPTSIRHLSISSTRLAKPEPTSSSPVSFASPDTPLDTTPAQSGALTPEDQAYKPQRIPPSVTQRLAKEVRRRGPINTETYIAYGATAELFKECARQADYTIPQVLEGGEAPKTAKGEDLGVGEGWWYNGM